MIFEPKQRLGILDLGSLCYNKIRQGVLQQNFSKCYHFESAEKLCEEFNTLVNGLKKDEKISKKRHVRQNQNRFINTKMHLV